MVAVPVIALANAAYTFEPFLALSVTRLAYPSTYTYRWSATPAGKLTFPNNGTADAQQVDAPMDGGVVAPTISLEVTSTSITSGKSHVSRRTVEVREYVPAINASDTLGLCWRDTLTLSVPQTTLNPQAYLYTWSVTPNDGYITFSSTNGTIAGYQMEAYTAGLGALSPTYTFTCTVSSIATKATIERSREVRLSLFTPGFIVDNSATACAMRPGYIKSN